MHGYLSIASNSESSLTCLISSPTGIHSLYSKCARRLRRLAERGAFADFVDARSVV